MPAVVSVRRFCAGDHWNLLLRRYKDAPVFAARRHFRGLLTSELELFFAIHGECLGELTGGFEAFCVVPTSRPQPRVIASHPLESVLGDSGALSQTQLVRLALSEPTGHLSPSRGAFVPLGPAHPAGTRVLLIDDCWVTGARALSAVVALRSAGADVTGILVLGRMLQAPDLSRVVEPQTSCSDRCLVASRPDVPHGYPSAL
jgi:hypothetical protein